MRSEVLRSGELGANREQVGARLPDKGRVIDNGNHVVARRKKGLEVLNGANGLCEIGGSGVRVRDIPGRPTMVLDVILKDSSCVRMRVEKSLASGSIKRSTCFA